MTATVVGTYVADSGSAGTQTSIDLVYPAGIAEGDRILIVSGDLNGTTMTAPTGFTADAQLTAGSAGARLFRRTADGTESGTVTVSLSGTGSRLAAALIVVRGAAAPTEGVPTVDSDGTDLTLAIPTVTPPEDNCLLVSMNFLRHNATATTPNLTAPVGYTEASPGETVTSNGSGQRAGAYIATRTLGASTSGVSQNSGLVVTTSGAGLAGVSWMFAFPAAGSPPPSGPPAGWAEASAWVRLLNYIAGTVGLAAQGACQVWANSPGADLLEALNIKNGSAGMDLLEVLNSLAGTSGLDRDEATRAIAAAI